MIALVAALTIGGFTGARRMRLLAIVAVAGVALLIAVIVVGLITSFDVDVLTTALDPFDAFGIRASAI